MPGTHLPKKNSLSIKLTESAVFLRTYDSPRRRNYDSQPSMIRGLLTLVLAKPTKISSIELELKAKTSTSWPEGSGPHRIEVTEEHELFSASTVYFRAGPVQARRASIGPGVSHTETGHDEWDESEPLQPYTPRRNDEFNGEHESPTAYISPRHSPRAGRHASADSSMFQRTPFSHYEDPSLALTPPYTPYPTTPTMERPSMNYAHSGGSLSRVDENTAQTLEDFRSSLVAGLRSERRNQSSASPSIRSIHDRSLSRRQSIEDVHESEVGVNRLRHYPQTPTPPETGSPNEARGRRHSRFSLSLVSNALMDIVRPTSRPTSPMVRNFADSRERPEEDGRSRGRTMEKGRSIGSPSRSVKGQQSKERSTLGMFSDILIKLEGEDNKEFGDGWKEFKKGTYTYPISFTIPGNSPPSLHCAFGSVNWRLTATVHRPGTFRSKLAAVREVLVIACPTEDDTEDTDNIIVERHWDQQLQYLIAISGRSFYIGGTIPISFTLMPLAKVKVHRISVFLEERIDIYSQTKRIARSGPVVRTELFSLKGEGKNSEHILPLEVDNKGTIRNATMLTLATTDEDPSERISSWMGPGPWTFHQDMTLPSSCTSLCFTNRNKKSNIVISHIIKCVIRVERGDDTHIDESTGKRKLFDIIVQAPLHILSCRCNPEWTSLPQYSESFTGSSTDIPCCPCEMKRRAKLEEANPNRPVTLERMVSHRSTDSDASAAETSPVNPATMLTLQADSLLGRSTQFERLISGQESEIGEAPPTYDHSMGRAATLLMR